MGAKEKEEIQSTFTLSCLVRLWAKQMNSEKPAVCYHVKVDQRR